MFLLHIALEAPLAIQGMFSPQGLPFLDATNTTLVIIKVRGFSPITLSKPLTPWLAFRSSMQRFQRPRVSPRSSYSLSQASHIVSYHVSSGNLTIFSPRHDTEYLPGKRAFAAGLTVYHTLVAGTLFQAPRFIPKTFGVLLER
jgi:hypothetical protein